MRYVKPHFYDDFKCIADKCPDTCCAGWQIMIDEESLERYACRDSGEKCFEERLKRSIDWQEGSFYQYNGRCAMLNEKNLCDLVIEKGEKWLCNTCDRYPRHIEEFEGLREMSLSLSCPVAAERMLQERGPMGFIVEEDEEPDPLEEEFEDFDFLLFTQLEDARAVLFEIVQNRKLPIKRRLDEILAFGRQLQECLDDNRLFDMEEIIRDFAEVNKRDFCEGASLEADNSHIAELKKRQAFEQITDGFHMLEQLERLRDDWTTVLDETRKTLYEGGYERYELIADAFAHREESRDESDGKSRKESAEEMDISDWEIFQEQILMFFLYTYFCGAVYDDCIFSKVALAVFSVFYIKEFVMCKWFLSDKYIDKHACIRIAYRYAREVEHSDENLVALEEWLLEKM